MSATTIDGAPIPSATIGEVVIREITPEEYGALAGLGLFQQFAVPPPDQSRCVVAQRVSDYKIVAYWFVFQAIHVEPLWIDPEYRKRPGLIRRLWTGVQEVLEDVFSKLGLRPVAFCVIGDASAANVLPYATRLGFKRVPGSLFFVDVRAEGDTTGPLDQMLEELKKQGPPAFDDGVSPPQEGGE